MSHADTLSEDFCIHSMKTIKLDLGLEVVTIAIIQIIINKSSYNKLLQYSMILQPCKQVFLVTVLLGYVDQCIASMNILLKKRCGYSCITYVAMYTTLIAIANYQVIHARICIATTLNS